MDNTKPNTDQPQPILSTAQLRHLLQTFKKQHAKEYGLQALGYFGSYSRQTATEDSDIDIIFDTNTPNLLLTAMMKQDLEELLGKNVDVLRLHDAMNPTLKARIQKEAVYV
ncbi:MAG: nucleotidyltransferase domain-containing protein [Thiolinea sp.]